ncbi:Gfo/Idh/MocA family protein [Amycolatopsis jejuensis]|uniref:Gfo/Idh/MocA family protein n=1 Tax=Amycolatopsis jejuensis TaxID=330084 RepID=UPI0005258399|nr:Gfo/Idh/MocA family oxidoreductase [Amycolatopsis jejuensis]
MSTLRWGLVGASDIAATRMIPAMRRLGHPVTAVCSSSAAHAADYADRNEIPYHTTDLDAFLNRDDIDAVYLSSTNERHCPQAIAAAAAGKHVLCEKPLALTIEDAESMVAACVKAGVTFAVNHHLPGAATHREIRRLVAGGAVGRPLAVRVFHAVSLPERLRGWRLQDSTAGAGVVLDITCHSASVVNALLGSPQAVTALSVRQGEWDSVVDDAAMSVVRYEGDVLAQLHDAFTVGYASTGFEVHGTEGSIVATDVMTQDPVGRVVLRDSAGVREIEIPDRPDLYETVLTAFAADEPSVTAADGIDALSVALAVRRSAETGQTVDLT